MSPKKFLEFWKPENIEYFKESALYSIYARVVDVSEIERVRFLIQKQRMRKYRTTSYINEGKEL